MSGAGHVQDMNNRIRQNRAQRPSKRRKFKDRNRESIYSSGDKAKGKMFKRVSEEKLAEIKARIAGRAEKERKYDRMFYLIFTMVVLTGTIVFFLWIRSA